MAQVIKMGDGLLDREWHCSMTQAQEMSDRIIALFRPTGTLEHAESELRTLLLALAINVTAVAEILKCFGNYESGEIERKVMEYLSRKSSSLEFKRYRLV